jgi:hypothetical protein
VLIGVDGDFRTLMLAADAALQDLQWQSHEGDWPGQLVDEYWDLRPARAPTAGSGSTASRARTRCGETT